MAHQTLHNTDSHAHSKVGHVMPMWALISVWLGLVILTFLTVAATWIDLGSMNLILAMGIATIKAALVILFFMHLYYDHPFNAFVFIVSLFFVALMVIGTMIDSSEYQHLLIEGYAPEIQR